jgi:hypothetical protein
MADPALKSLHSFLAYANQPGAALYFHAEHADSCRDLALGCAALLSKPVHVFEFAGDYVEADEGDALLQPLLRGETVLIAFSGPGPLAKRFLTVWSDANRSSTGGYWGGIGIGAGSVGT